MPPCKVQGARGSNIQGGVIFSPVPSRYYNKRIEMHTGHPACKAVPWQRGLAKSHTFTKKSPRAQSHSRESPDMPTWDVPCCLDVNVWC